MLSVADLHGRRNRAESAIADLMLSGLALRQRRIENHFGIWCTTWIQKLQQHLFPNFKDTVTGNISTTLPTMSHPETLTSTEVNLMEEVIGFYNLESAWKDWEEE